ncbi:probable N-acetyltransferase CML5 [Takifugu flavidus]|nr:probable N-acetyltransferase CML5 [Takifugu flavidus]
MTMPHVRSTICGGHVTMNERVRRPPGSAAGITQQIRESSTMNERFSSVMQLLIRKYEPSDKDAACRLFRTGILEHIHPCFHNAMTTPLYIFITVALSAAGILLGSVLGALVLPGIWVGLIYYSCHRLYSSFVLAKLQTDMRDISRSYLSRPGDCFWVAEAQIDGMSQIVGIVAVVAKQSAGKQQGELFRMIISPLCRRMGLGARLTQTVIDFCKEHGFSEVVLETSTTQAAAVALYKKLGFHIVLTHTETEAPFWIVMLTKVKILKMKKYL